MQKKLIRKVIEYQPFEQTINNVKMCVSKAYTSDVCTRFFAHISITFFVIAFLYLVGVQRFRELVTVHTTVVLVWKYSLIWWNEKVFLQ